MSCRLLILEEEYIEVIQSSQKYKTAKPLYTAYKTTDKGNSLELSDRKKDKFSVHSKKTESVGAEVTSGRKLFQRRLPATGNSTHMTEQFLNRTPAHKTPFRLLVLKS